MIPLFDPIPFVTAFFLLFLYLGVNYEDLP